MEEWHVKIAHLVTYQNNLLGLQATRDGWIDRSIWGLDGELAFQIWDLRMSITVEEEDDQLGVLILFICVGFLKQAACETLVVTMKP